MTFPTDIALRSTGGPQRNTEIVVLGSGHEQRNQRWSQSLRRFDAGYGIKSLNKLHEVIAFYEARRGPLFGFRFRDPMDWKSGLPLSDVSEQDQLLAITDGVQSEFQIVKYYGLANESYRRDITKPVANTVKLSLDNVLLSESDDYTVDYLTGLITFPSPPTAGKPLQCGFQFDVPVRFNTDQLNINLAAFSAGDIPSVPLVEVRS